MSECSGTSCLVLWTCEGRGPVNIHLLTTGYRREMRVGAVCCGLFEFYDGVSETVFNDVFIFLRGEFGAFNNTTS